MLNRAKYYYRNDKERLRNNARDKHQNLPEEEKNKWKGYGSGIGTIICLKKKKLKEYQKNYSEAKKIHDYIRNKLLILLILFLISLYILLER